jgi:uncharacterized membrane protein YkvA (DUF1232 family)
MRDFFATVQLMLFLAAISFVAFMGLLSLPQSRLRSVLMEMAKYGLALLFALLIVSPIDAVPDLIPLLGWGDDVGYLLGAISAFASARKERANRKFLPR